MKPETCYWNEQTAALVGDRIHKIREYLRRKLIRVDPELPWIFYVDPTPSRHQIHTVDTKLWTCTCQNFGNGNECSHIWAVKLFLDGVHAGTRDLYEGYNRWLEEKNSHQNK